MSYSPGTEEKTHPDTRSCVTVDAVSTLYLAYLSTWIWIQAQIHKTDFEIFNSKIFFCDFVIGKDFYWKGFLLDRTFIGQDFYWKSTLIVGLLMELQRLRANLSRQRGLRLVAKIPLKDSKTRLRRGRYDHHRCNHRWHKEHCRPLQLSSKSLVLEAGGRSPSSPAGCHQCRWQPGWSEIQFLWSRSYILRIICTLWLLPWLFMWVYSKESTDIHSDYAKVTFSLKTCLSAWKWSMFMIITPSDEENLSV